MSEIIIESYKINHSTSPFIIAEAGVNHNGSLALALQLIDTAAECGAHAIKFQTFRADQVVTIDGKMANYQKRNLGKDLPQREMIKEIELQEQWYPTLIKRCREKNIIFLSTPHGGKPSVDLLQSYKIPAFKFGSGDLTNLPLLEYTAKLDKPMLISTGMANLAEVKEAVDCIKKCGNEQILIFHCTTDYPCAPQYVNLRCMQTLADELRLLVGYSDHTLGHTTSCLAVALGASMIEKHITLDRRMTGPDHVASAEPKEFKELIKLLKGLPRNYSQVSDQLNLDQNEVEVLMGSAKKEPQIPELQYLSVARKSIVSAQPIKAGEVFTEENLTIKRPGNGIQPKYLPNILGRIAKFDIAQDVLLEEKMITA
jgi:sialic acid synthase SpsE